MIGSSKTPRWYIAVSGSPREKDLETEIKTLEERERRQGAHTYNLMIEVDSFVDEVDD